MLIKVHPITQLGRYAPWLLLYKTSSMCVYRQAGGKAISQSSMSNNMQHSSPIPRSSSLHSLLASSREGPGLQAAGPLEDGRPGDLVGLGEGVVVDGDLQSEKSQQHDTVLPCGWAVLTLILGSFWLQYPGIAALYEASG